MTLSQNQELQEEALERLISVTSGEASGADLQALKAWRLRSAAHAEAYRQALSLWNSLEIAARESATAKDRALASGLAHIDNRTFNRRALLAGGVTAVAAVAAVAMVKPPIGLWPTFSELMADYRTDTGEQRTITLAQGASVEMNTRTSIVRRPADVDGEFIEILSGEAAISMPRDRGQLLRVIAGDGRITAARSQFNLRYDDGIGRVTCSGGSVDVECRGQITTVRSGQQLVYSANSAGLVMSVDPAAVMNWRQGLLIFTDEPLVGVVNEVNRYRRGRIVLFNQELGARRVTARIEVARIDEVISYVQAVLGAKARMLPGGIVVLT